MIVLSCLKVQLCIMNSTDGGLEKFQASRYAEEKSLLISEWADQCTPRELTLPGRVLVIPPIPRDVPVSGRP